MQLKMIPLRDIRPVKTYSPKDPAVQVLVVRIRKVGFLNPLIVDNNKNILDGDKRYAALVAMYGQDWTAPVVVVGALGEKDSMAVRALLNTPLKFAEDDLSVFIDPYLDALRSAFLQRLDMEILLEHEASHRESSVSLRAIKQELHALADDEEDVPFG
ncbi:ParB-like nuclease domain-containing protein [Desulfacinum hydrothermale DSM 13146]|uniref:ParB-like nuclease domain-containing protein n=1 Tax=Desulfacinum hydrothermale DSM 13146 TaxID=1121390 RepID=A0A1W1XWR2_9BACT|nr:ParB N-terminal domain-containing protein [Desulfacinum hydrothermale]SMC28305.1 ParB-like nuclease domain-containing protein [Desulfacinum hydrothermale DSM 13146]